MANNAPCNPKPYIGLETVEIPAVSLINIYKCCVGVPIVGTMVFWYIEYQVGVLDKLSQLEKESGRMVLKE